MHDQQLAAMMAAVASAPDQPNETFRALEEVVRDTIGVVLFTLMEIDHKRGVAWRNYSNMPEAYPVSGEKPVEDDSWSDIVEKQQRIFVANSIEEIAAVFPDHELIQQLGCESCINIPVFIAGKLRGTLNCLHVAGHYTAERVAAAENLKLAGAVAFMMAAASRSQGINHV